MAAASPNPEIPNGISAASDAAPATDTGLIIPPREIRDLIEKTAPFIARSGPSFEEKLREKEKFNPKFSFLNPFDAYHRYFDLRVQASKDNKQSIVTPKTNGTTVKQAAKEATKDPPRAFQFSAPLPPISAQDLDILRLTAQFVAKNGRSFITTLSQRESRNYQFDFLRSNHSLYPYFNVMVQQYLQILAPPPPLNAFLSQSREEILQRCQWRADYVKSQALAKMKQKEDEEKERIAYASIDWHSFVVVETIQFTASDQSADLAPPVDLQKLKTASLEQKDYMARLDEPTLALTASTPMLTIGDQPYQVQDHTNANRRSYLPHTTAMVECPRCHNMFRSDEINEHIRIESLDPKWKQQKERETQKRSGTNLDLGSAAQNLKRLNESHASEDDAKRRKE